MPFLARPDRSSPSLPHLVVSVLTLHVDGAHLPSLPLPHTSYPQLHLIAHHTLPSSAARLPSPPPQSASLASSPLTAASQIYPFRAWQRVNAQYAVSRCTMYLKEISDEMLMRGSGLVPLKECTGFSFTPTGCMLHPVPKELPYKKIEEDAYGNGVYVAAHYGVTSV